jgi:ABC-type transporter Mla subunit MlaD
MSIRRITPVLLLAAAAIVLAVVLTGADSKHHVYLQTADATGALAGQDVRLAGQKVGKVESVKPADDGRSARIGLSLDDRAWPLRTSSKLVVRWGGTVSYLKRYVAIQPGAASAAAYPEGATLPKSAVVTPVDFDELINQFSPRIRGAYSAFLDRGGATLKQSAPDLHAVIDRTPAALSQADLLLTSLAQSRSQLRTLVTSTGRVVDAIQTADPSVDQAVEGAAATLAATAHHTAAIRRTLAVVPGTLVRVRSTLATADRTLDLAQAATRRIGPGVSELRRTVTPLNQLLERVVTVGPLARSTLSTARTSAPAITKLVSRATALLPAAKSALDQANPQLECIRPYTPDIVQIGTNWSGFISAVDSHDYYARVNPSALAFAPTTAESRSTADAKRAFPGMRYGFPRPPGDSAGQPWFLPDCGAGRDAIDPFKDYEARPGANGR